MHALCEHSLEDEDTPDVVNAELPITNEKADELDKSFEHIDVAVSMTHTHMPTLTLRVSTLTLPVQRASQLITFINR
jgi:hypothetical protein